MAARVSHYAADERGVAHHLNELRCAVVRMRNPSLIAAYERLKQRLLGQAAPAARDRELPASAEAALGAALAACAEQPARAAMLLGKLLAASGSHEGYLYVAAATGPRLVARSGSSDAPDAVTARVHELLSALENADDSDARTAVELVDSAVSTGPIGVPITSSESSAYTFVPLRVGQRGCGGVVVVRVAGYGDQVTAVLARLADELRGELSTLRTH